MPFADHAQFASTTAGYVTGILAPIMFVFLGFIGSSFFRWRHGIDTTLAQQNQALAVLVSQSDQTTREVHEATTRISSVSESTAVLKATLDDHVKWSADIDQRWHHPSP